MKWLAALLVLCACACTDARKRFEDFEDRVVDAGPDAAEDATSDGRTN